MKIFIGSIFFILLLTNLEAQETRYAGSLIKINFYDNFIDTNKTIGNWESIYTNNYSSDQYFEKVFTYNNTIYLIKNSFSQTFGNYIPPSLQKSLINTNSKSEKTFCSFWPPECGTGIYLSTSVDITSLQDGFGLVINYPLVSYIFSADTLYQLNTSDSLPNIFHIVGKVDNRFLVVARNKENYNLEYYLEELNRQESPKFNRAISFENIPSPFGTAPLKTIHLLDSLYLMNFQWNNYLYLMSFSDNRLTRIDSLELNQNFWLFKNNKLFYYDGQYLVTRDFDKTGMKFKEQKNFIKVGSKNCFDYSGNYFATIDSDTLKIFSVKNESLINKLYLTNFSRYGSMLIDSPFVYIHKTDLVTGVNDDVILPNKFELYQNYPNPFNPNTVISYQLPVSSHASLKVFDLLGKEVATLVEGIKSAGKYEVTFDASKLSSGVYLYILKAGKFAQTNKMLLMK